MDADATPPATDWSGLEILSIDECHRLLRAHHVGRLAFVEAGSPVILPVNYSVDGHAVVFRTGRGSKLASAIMGAAVCFEIDDHDPVEHTGWSVVMKGLADHVLDQSELDRLDGLPLMPWSSPDVRQDWVRVMPEEITGRRIPRTPGA